MATIAYIKWSSNSDNTLPGGTLKFGGAGGGPPGNPGGGGMFGGLIPVTNHKKWLIDSI